MHVEKEQRWAFDAEISGTSQSKGVTRKILAYHDEGMCVAHIFEAGAGGEPHSHPHTQITYVAEGVFEFDIDGKKNVVKKGDAMFKESGVEHSAVCLEKGVLIDFFTPMREDFICGKSD